jgi:hypothetical protein
VHDIERYGIGKSELALFRNAKRATLLFVPRDNEVSLTLLADDVMIGRHTVAAGEFPEVLAGYAHVWNGAAGGTNAKERSFVSVMGTKGQGVDTNLPPHGPPKGYPPANYMVHEQLRVFATIANQTPERG